MTSHSRSPTLSCSTFHTLILLLPLILLLTSHPVSSFTPVLIPRSLILKYRPKTTLFSSAANKVPDKLGVSAGATNGVYLLGTGSSTPKTYISNSDLEAVVETSDEWIRTRTGIGGRRVLLHEGDEVSWEQNGGKGNKNV